MKKQIEIPEWMVEEEIYEPCRDRDSLWKKTSGQILKVLGKIKMQTVRRGKKEISAGIGLLLLFVTVILTVGSKSLYFPAAVCCAMLLLLAGFDGESIRGILAETCCGVAFALVFTLPAALAGNVYPMQIITAKTAVTVMAASLLNHKIRWNQICASLNRLHLPGTLLLVFDMTVKYLVVLGRICKNLLDAMALRSIGKNQEKKKAAGGILGVTYLKSQQMAQETYFAMNCRGYDGTYRYYMEHKINIPDVLLVFLLAGEIAIYIYLRKL